MNIAAGYEYDGALSRVLFEIPVPWSYDISPEITLVVVLNSLTSK